MITSLPYRRSPAVAPPAGTHTEWSSEFDTLRREKLFRAPPKDHSAYPLLAAAIEPHVQSFNNVFEKGGLLEHAVRDIGVKMVEDGDPYDETLTDRNRFSIRIRQLYLDHMVLPPTNKSKVRDRNVLPAECRERHASYRGKFSARIEVRVNNGEWEEMVRELGQIPLMLRSNRCHLEGMTPAELVQAKEESEELGGYFIINGNERLVRFLVLPRRNFPRAASRPKFKKKGKGYTKHAITIRSVRPDETSITSYMHYIENGDIQFGFNYRRTQFLLPVGLILNALVETNDREIFEGIVGSTEQDDIARNQSFADKVELLLNSYKVYSILEGVHHKASSRAHLGRRFRVHVGLPDSTPDEDVGTEFLRKVILPHLGSYDVTESQNYDKFRFICFMIRKLYAVVEGECAVDNPDVVSNQEILLGGHCYGMIIKERLEDWLNAVCAEVLEWSKSKDWAPFTQPEFMSELVSKVFRKTNQNIGQALQYFLATGNLVSNTGLDLNQAAGFTIVAEKLNFSRFISHFRMVHRGSFFAQMRTTSHRKLMPESWGFLCPVHTPDGAPCGLLHHLAHRCIVASRAADVSAIPSLLGQLGVSPAYAQQVEDSVVLLNGRVLGYCSPSQAKVIAASLRYWKVEGTHDVPKELEIGYIPTTTDGGQYPGIYLSSHPARMFRPVKYLPLNALDYVGSLEQPHMSIACTEPEIVSGNTTHVEYDPSNMLSIVANMTPFSEFNQSPRNMYQCQMGKQTMGTQGTATRYRTDNKTYRLQTGQTPISRAHLHTAYGFDNFPNGTNAVVAVVAYTGYDMDDAMIINKSAHERGFAHGTVYKTEKIGLDDFTGLKGARTTKTTALFGFAPNSLVRAEWRNHLDDDGMPIVGTLVRQGDFIAAGYTVTQDPSTGAFVNRDGETHFKKYKDVEPAFIEEVRVLGAETGSEPCRAISVKFRVPRAPVVGDKFSSRHGQKGVCSQQWRGVDLPFSESGMQPDVIINPHAFPSRMTIGMFVESLAGKAGALHGLAQDSTPFSFSETHTAADYFGQQLRRAGYSYHGSEPMYSGTDGQPLAADVYLGVVFYQRLRHMVADKWQARTTGPVNALTGQPIHGRSRGGGTRFGEMERDALIAHGASVCLQDRLFACSDRATGLVCRACGSLVAPLPAVAEFGRRYRAPPGGAAEPLVRCRGCATRAQGWEPKGDVWEDGHGGTWVGGEDVSTVPVPTVLKLLGVDFASMGVKLQVKIEP